MPEKSKWRFQYKNLKVQEAMQEFEGWTEKDFVKHILELRKEVIDMEQENEALQSKLNIPADQEKGKKPEDVLNEGNFDPEWSYPTKLAFLLTINDKPLASQEMHTMLVKLDKHYKAYTDPKGTLSVYLTMTVKRGRIKRIKLPGIKTLYFALPEWVTENGVLDDKYKRLIKLF